ncbi:MAG: dTMP kinase [Bacteroidetes bacterium]|nr:dTMP kinase [Bacteroidota bacterium]
MFISFEGLDGSGKSTQIRLLADWISSQGLQPRLLREPGGTDWSEACRKVLLEHRSVSVNPVAEVLLFFSARAQLVSEVIGPGLEAGEVVLLDRYVDSSLAYQGYGHGLPLGFLKTLAYQATGGLLPVKTIYLDVDFDTAVARQTGRGERDRMESMDRDRFNRIRQGYHALIADDPGRFLVIPATGEPAAIHASVVSALSPLMKGISSR